jgi:hypothetical protein
MSEEQRQPLEDWIYDLSKPGRSLSRQDIRDLADALRIQEARDRKTLVEWYATLATRAGTPELRHDTSPLTIPEAILFSAMQGRDWALQARDLSEESAGRQQFVDLFFEQHFGASGYRSPDHQRVVSRRGQPADHDALPAAPMNGQGRLPDGGVHES